MSKTNMDAFISSHLDSSVLYNRIEEQFQRAAVHHALGNDEQALVHSQKAQELLSEATKVSTVAFEEMKKLLEKK